MNEQRSKWVAFRITTAVLASLGLAVGLVALPVSAQGLVVATGDPSAASETASDAVNAAMRTAELAISRAADVGKSVALRLTSGGSPRALVLPSGDLSAEDADRIAEDLGVMSRILEKAAGQSSDRGDRFWLNGVLGGAFGRGPDALYLGGFGVLFLLRVDYALVGPKSVRTEEKAEVADRTWEETRRELREGGQGETRIWDVMTGPSARSARGEYDPARVQDLRTSLVQALKHASNLDRLKPDDTVAVTVFGPAIGDGERVAKPSGRVGYGSYGASSEDGGRGGSLLTLRVKKSDVDVFAKGKLTAEEFSEKIQETLR